MISDRLYRRYYPDDSLSGTLAFYRWVRRHLRHDTVLLNLGAGPPTNDPVRCLKGEVARVTGADVDPVVLQNHELDDAIVVTDGALPFEDDRFDIVLSDYVLEHVEQPRRFIAEVRRVLKPSGSFFFRTPNMYHYVALIARLTPYRFHTLLANRVRGLPKEAHEPHRTFYLLNNRQAISQAAADCGFGLVELRLCEAEPMYLRFNSLAFLTGVLYERVVNRFEKLAPLRANIFGRLSDPPRQGRRSVRCV